MRQPGKSTLRTLESYSGSGFSSANPEARFHAGWAAPGLRRLKGDEGNSLLEYAFIAMLFMIMILGIVDFGRALYAYHFVSHAAREATRYAAVRGSTCNDDGSCSLATPDTGPAQSTNTVIQDYVNSIVPSGLDSSKVTTTPNWPVQTTGPTACTTIATQNSPGCTVEVQVTYAFRYLYPFIHNGSINLSSTSEMVIVH
jgi:Flp pilus assembly protein TadG